MVVYCVIRQKRKDDWDPDERVGDPTVVAILDDLGHPSNAIRKDATAILKNRGFSETEDKDVFDDFIRDADVGAWCRPAGIGDEEWRWTVTTADLNLRAVEAER